jgi:hypothetical protein
VNQVCSENICELHASGFTLSMKPIGTLREYLFASLPWTKPLVESRHFKQEGVVYPIGADTKRESITYGGKAVR